MLLKSFLISFIFILFISNVHAEPDLLSKRNVFVEEGNNEMGNFRYGDLLYCLKTAEFPPDYGPRKINTSNQRLIVTNILNQQWAIGIREFPDKVLIESIVIDTQNYYTPKEKRKYLLRLLGHCKLDNAS